VVVFSFTCSYLSRPTSGEETSAMLGLFVFLCAVGFYIRDCFKAKTRKRQRQEVV